MKTVSFIAIGLFLTAQAASAATWSIISFSTEPQNAPAILAAADALRRDDDRRFAQGLVQWAEAGRPATEVTPIDPCGDRSAFDSQSYSCSSPASDRPPPSPNET